jgi:hypothetical protein
MLNPMILFIQTNRALHDRREASRSEVDIADLSWRTAHPAPLREETANV